MSALDPEDAALLSRLADGELDGEAQERLRARIAQEPALAEAWDRLDRLGLQVRALLDARPPPPALDARVVARVVAVDGQPARRAPIGGLALAAVVLVGIGLGVGVGVGAGITRAQRVGEVALADGAARVDGRAELRVGELRIAVDGEAAITVEPADGAARVTASGGRMHGDTGRDGRASRRTAWLAAAAGAAVTVAVFEGRAVVFAGDAPPITVPAGSRTTVGRAAKPAPSAPAPTGPTGDLAADNARLTQENALLQTMLSDLELEYRGTPVAWTDDIPAVYRQPAFERTVRDAVAACAPDLDVVGFECSEPPCFALLRPSRDDWWDRLVNNCPAWRDAYTNSVSSASGTATCPDGTTERYQVLGWSYGLVAPPGGFTAEDEENRGKRFTARIDEIERNWACAGRER